MRTSVSQAWLWLGLPLAAWTILYAVAHLPVPQPSIPTASCSPVPPLPLVQAKVPPGRLPLRSAHPGREPVVCELPALLHHTEQEVERMVGTPFDTACIRGRVGERRRNTYCLPAEGRVIVSFRDGRSDRAELYFELKYPTTLEDALRAGDIHLAELREKCDRGLYVSWTGAPGGVACKRIWVLVAAAEHRVTGVCITASAPAPR